jgi:hypothetical protein
MRAARGAGRRRGGLRTAAGWQSARGLSNGNDELRRIPICETSADDAEEK